MYEEAPVLPGGTFPAGVRSPPVWPKKNSRARKILRSMVFVEKTVMANPWAEQKRFRTRKND
jgi:hypothetical protein